MAWSARQFFGKLAAKSAPPPPPMTLLPQQAAGVEYLLDPVATPSSSWVSSFAYARHRRREGMLVQFKSGATCFYPNTSERHYHAMDAADSRGQYVHDHLYDLDYELL